MFCHFIIVEWIHLSSSCLCHFSFHQLHILSSKKKLLFIHLQRFFFYIIILFWVRTTFLEQISPVPLFIALWFIHRVVSASIKTSCFFFFNSIRLENAFRKHILLLLRYFQSMNHSKFKLK